MPPFPKALAYLWRAYFRLRRRMAGGFAGPNPIGWQDIDAFVRQSGLRLAPWELDLIEALDDLYLEALSGPKAGTAGAEAKGPDRHGANARRRKRSNPCWARSAAAGSWKKKGERPHG